MDKKIKTYLIIGAIALVLLVSLLIYAYHAGKKTTSIAPVVKDDPNAPANDPTNNPAGVSDTDIKTLVEKLYKDMSGANVLGHDSQAYKDLLALSDTDFERVYNEFNSEYQKDSGQTFKGWINGEGGYGLTDLLPWPFSGNADFRALKDSTNQRFAKLNLK